MTIRLKMTLWYTLLTLMILAFVHTGQVYGATSQHGFKYFSGNKQEDRPDRAGSLSYWARITPSD